MKKPAMVLFDYGNTIITENLLGFEKGNEVLLSMAAENPQNITINELQPFIAGLIGEISDRMGAATRNRQPFEISWCSLNRYAYEYFGITFDKPYEELEEIYWDSIVTASPSENIEELLSFLGQNGIRTGVVSNLMYSGRTLRRRIERLIPDHGFEFILSSCDYVFRKPEGQLFGLALKKAGLNAENVWFCGDNPVCDIEGAHSAGMQPVWYKKTYIEKPDLKITLPRENYIAINDWAELKEIIKGCLD